MELVAAVVVVFLSCVHSMSRNLAFEFDFLYICFWRKLMIIIIVIDTEWYIYKFVAYFEPLKATHSRSIKIINMNMCARAQVSYFICSAPRFHHTWTRIPLSINNNNNNNKTSSTSFYLTCGSELWLFFLAGLVLLLVGGNSKR